MLNASNRHRFPLNYNKLHPIDPNKHFNYILSSSSVPRNKSYIGGAYFVLNRKRALISEWPKYIGMEKVIFCANNGPFSSRSHKNKRWNYCPNLERDTSPKSTCRIIKQKGSHKQRNNIFWSSNIRASA